MKPAKIEERRRCPRMFLNELTHCCVSIKEHRGEQVCTRQKPVLVLNISPTGLCFISDLKFPLHTDYIVDFEAVIFRETIHLEGRIIWRQETDFLNKYGVRFRNSEQVYEFLLRNFNNLTLTLSPDKLKAHELYEYFANDIRRQGGKGV